MIQILPCLSDNYSYLITRDSGKETIIVDPSDASPILEALRNEKLHPIAVLCTHHHGDHIGGLQELLAVFPELRVYCHQHDRMRIQGATELVEHEQEVVLDSFKLKALHVPGHTLGAVAWLIDGCLFSGDTLFVAGCGRLFEGSAAMMYQSLCGVLGALDDSTRIYCGHEYTTSNLRFAVHVEPDNAHIVSKFAWSRSMDVEKKPTVPSTLQEERRTNPFLRCSEPSVMAYASKHGASPTDPTSVFGVLREQKNNFRP